MLRRLFGFDWKNSPAHLLLLSKFGSPLDPSHFYGDERWESVLGEKPKKAINRFIKEGLVKEADLAGLMAHKYKVSELKPMLRERGLKVSGRKAELIERLIEDDPETMQQGVRGLRILQWTQEGQGIAEQYLEQEKAKYLQVEQQVLQALKQHKFKDACQAVAAYEANQVFARGIGIDWADYSPDRDVSLLNTIFKGKPKILADLDNEQLGHLRIAAGMMELWGTSRTRRGWLPEGFETEHRLGNDTAARMLLFYAIQKHEMDQYRRHDYAKTVKILTAGKDSCEECQKLTRKNYALDKAPELPYVGCTHKMGCRCTVVVAEFS